MMVGAVVAVKYRTFRSFGCFPVSPPSAKHRYALGDLHCESSCPSYHTTNNVPVGACTNHSSRHSDESLFNIHTFYISYVVHRSLFESY